MLGKSGWLVAKAGDPTAHEAANILLRSGEGQPSRCSARNETVRPRRASMQGVEGSKHRVDPPLPMMFATQSLSEVARHTRVQRRRPGLGHKNRQWIAM